MGGFRWRPIRGLRVSFDAEVGRADRPLSPIGEREFHNETARVQWRKKAFVFGASFKSAVNDNSASLINHSYTSRQFGVNTSWTQQDGRFTLDANYTKLDLNTASGIFDFFPATEPGEERHNFYTSNLHTLYQECSVRLEGNASNVQPRSSVRLFRPEARCARAALHSDLFRSARLLGSHGKSHPISGSASAHPRSSQDFRFSCSDGTSLHPHPAKRNHFSTR